MKEWLHDRAVFGWVMAAGFITTVGSIALSAEVAEAITLTELNVYESTGQTLSYNFTNLPFTGDDGTLRIYNGVSRSYPGIFDGLDIDGQFDTNQEFFTLLVEGNDVGRYGCSVQPGIRTLPNSQIQSKSDCTFDVTFSFLSDFGLDLPVLLADGSLSVQTVFSDRVHHFGDQDELFVELSYSEAVAIPAFLLPNNPPIVSQPAQAIPNPSQPAQAIPTPALLPSVLGMGAALLRQRRKLMG